eukprot:1151960-Pelagomonas_calceolata.AAC.2
MAIRRVTSSSWCLISVVGVGKSLLKSAYGANKFTSVLDRMDMKLQSKLDGCVSVKTKLLKRLQSVRGVDDPTHTKQNGMEDGDIDHGAAGWRRQADSGPGVFIIFDLHKMDVSLSWKELTRVTDLGSRWSGWR